MIYGTRDGSEEKVAMGCSQVTSTFSTASWYLAVGGGASTHVGAGDGTFPCEGMLNRISISTQWWMTAEW